LSCFVVVLNRLQGIPAGSQVYDSYGQKCNHRFLLNYGFAVEDNREMDGFCPNEVPIQLSVNPNDPLYLAKVKFWTRGEADSLHAAVAGFADAQSLSAAIDAATKCKEEDCDGVSPIKRVRVCISNNENTRLLLVCSVPSPATKKSSRPSQHPSVTALSVELCLECQINAQCK
jgi:hypothetical protein